jgi:REP element-mobilizing transposase RayT
MVLVTKYRNPVLTRPVKEHIYSTIKKTMEEKEIRILEMNGEPDHIHSLLKCRLTNGHTEDPYEA